MALSLAESIVGTQDSRSRIVMPFIGSDKTYPSEIPHRVAMRKQMMAAAISFQAC
jgi:hypothetical protein